MSLSTDNLAAPHSGGSAGGGPAPDSPARPGPLSAHPILAGLRSVSSETDLRRIVEAAASDEHLPIAPSHFVEKDGQVIAYASIGLVPMTLCWVHTQKVRARESLALLSQMEALAGRVAPAGIIFNPCSFNSPFHRFMPKLGYTHCGDGGFFLKRLARRQPPVRPRE